MEERARLSNEMRERTIGYIAGALGLVAGLAWNDAIKTLIEYFFPLSSQNISVKITYAFFITFVVVFATIYLMRLSRGVDLPK